MSAQGNVRHIKSSERTLRAHGCAEKGCQKDSLTATPSGVLTWLSPHGDDGRDKHPNSITIFKLVTWFIDGASKSALLNLREMIDRKLERMVA